MFGEFPEIFNKNFAVGFFLPVVTFLIITLVLLNAFGVFPSELALDTTSQSDVLVKTAVLGLMSWLGGIFLLAVNQELLLFLEGYGRFNPFRLFGAIEIRRYRKLQKEIDYLDEKFREFDAKEEEFPIHFRLKRNRLMHAFAEKFPSEDFGLLPTSFGNTVRAFQVYPQVMYGLDAMPGWGRLLTIIPEEYNGLINDAKSQVDFWINLCSLFFITLVEYVILAFFAGRVGFLWFPCAVMISIFFAYSRAESAAIQWGSMVKSAYDTFLPDLRKKLAFPICPTIREENSLWQRFSQSIIYLKPEYMPDRKISIDENDEPR